MTGMTLEGSNLKAFKFTMIDIMIYFYLQKVFANKLRCESSEVAEMT